MSDHAIAELRQALTARSQAHLDAQARMRQRLLVLTITALPLVITLLRLGSAS